MNNRTFAQLCKIAEAEVWIFKGFNISDDLSLILYKKSQDYSKMEEKFGFF